MSVGRGMGTAAMALAAVLATSTARGDGECAKGYRDTTAAERATMTAILEAAKKALPAAPQGWVIAGDESLSVPQGICRDYEPAPWSYSFTRYYQRVDDQEARNKKIEAAAAEMAADMEKKQPRLDAITAKMQELGQELAAAAQKGDYARTEEISKELEKISEQYKKIIEEGDSTERMNALGAEMTRDLEMTISVSVNPHSELPGTGAEQLRLAGGPQSAFHWIETRESVKEGHALILLGQWKPAADGRWEPVPRTNVAASAGHAISVRARADESRLLPMVNSIDLNTLTASLSK